MHHGALQGGTMIQNMRREHHRCHPSNHLCSPTCGSQGAALGMLPHCSCFVTLSSTAPSIQVRDQLTAKYGKDFVMEAIENQNDCVNSRVRVQSCWLRCV